MANILYNLERSIALIDKYIPQCNEILQSEEETQLYFTAVIQELLKRAANRGIRNYIYLTSRDFSSFFLFFSSDVFG